MAPPQGLLLTTNSNYHSGFDPSKLGSPATFSLTMSHRLEQNCRSTRSFSGTFGRFPLPQIRDDHQSYCHYGIDLLVR